MQIFLLALAPPSPAQLSALHAAGEAGVAATAGLKYLRGAEVIEIRDEEGQLFNDFRGRVKFEDAGRPRAGTRRTVLLALDPAQYQADVDALEPEGGAQGDGAGALSC